MGNCLEKGKLQFGTGCKRMNKEAEDTLCPKSSLWKEMRTVLRCCDRLPAEDQVPMFILLPRGEPWSTARGIEKHALS